MNGRRPVRQRRQRVGQPALVAQGRYVVVGDDGLHRGGSQARSRCRSAAVNARNSSSSASEEKVSAARSAADASG